MAAVEATVAEAKIPEVLDITAVRVAGTEHSLRLGRSNERFVDQYTEFCV